MPTDARVLQVKSGRPTMAGPFRIQRTRPSINGADRVVMGSVTACFDRTELYLTRHEALAVSRALKRHADAVFTEAYRAAGRKHKAGGK